MTKTTENTTQDTKETTTDDVKNTPQDRNNEKKMIKFINSVVEKGYSPETAEILWESRCQREAIRNDPNLSDEERKEAIKKTRENDLKTMKEDQKEGQKIKYAFRLYKKTEKMLKAILNAKTDEERQEKEAVYDKFVEENKEWAKDNKEIMRLVREEIKKKQNPTPPTKENKIEAKKDTTRQKIEANKEKTISSKRKKKTVKLTPTHNNMDENKTPIISLHDIKNKKLRA